MTIQFDFKSGCDVIPLPSVKYDANLALIRASNATLVGGKEMRPILFFHGATVPTMMTSAYRIDGLSWMDAMSADGRPVWGLDLLGYGEADPYPVMDVDSGTANPAEYGVAVSLIEEIDNAVDSILSETGFDSLHIIAISRGAIPAGYYSAAHPEKVRTLTLHGPITREDGCADMLVEKFFGTPSMPQISHFALSTADRFCLLRDDRPEGTVSPLEDGFVANWRADYSRRVHNDPARTEDPVLAPMGFAVDIYNAWNGVYFDESKIEMPTFILRGEWDHLLTSAPSCQRLFDTIGAREKRYLQLPQATHSMMFEKCRGVLHRETLGFAREFD